ncbi:hypothetical protein CL616_00415 [archaeon]|mgnify:CR=1 FL=1|nr:hypothetical protein [archaeon]
MQLDFLDDIKDPRIVFGRRKVRKKDDGDIIRESHLRQFYRCPHLYFLMNHVGLKKIPMSALAAMVSFFNARRTSMFGVFDDNSGAYEGMIPGIPRVGENLKLFQQMSSEEIRMYLPSPTKWFRDGWRGIRGRDKFDDVPLVWPFRENEHSPKTIREMTAAGINYQRFVVENGAPVYGFMNKDFTFRHNGLVFKVRFPELRDGCIDEPTIWGFNTHFRFRGKPKIKDSELVTMRLLAYHSIAHEYSLFRRKCDIGDVADKWGGEEMWIDPDTEYRHLDCHKDSLSVTTRSDQDIGAFLKSVDYFLEAREKEDFTPNFSYCGSCPGNVLDLEGKLICQEATGKSSPSVQRDYFDMSNYEVSVNGDLCNLVLEGKMNGKLVNRLVVNFGEEVTSTYFSFARGLGFEEVILQVMDDELYKIGGVHKIDFDRDFKFAGQKKIKLLLEGLGYENNEKKY